ncbi:MAG: S8 family serine peptidase [Candidatus Thermoplasmatota archaeon]|nr:S8 family serine peptidase [Candidatus Thermoplasmatota archaeon]
MTLEDLELMPEPEDSRLLTAVDPEAPGYSGSDYGLTDQEARELRWPLGPMKEFLWPWGAASFAVGTVLLLMTWSSIQPLLISYLPDSEWAYESSGIRELQTQGYYGDGVHVCIVDTGIDISHPDFDNGNLVGFRDFYAGDNDNIRDIGEDFHGTLMAGLLFANGTYVGAAPSVSLSVALALGPEGEAGQSDRVALAIRWCRISQDVDIISLSLGGEPGSGMSNLQSETVEAVNEALDAGIFVVAAAGNNGQKTNINDVSIPANIPRVIAVGASTSDGRIWANSSVGSALDPYYNEERIFPHQKPEVIAPGVRMFSTASTDITPPYAYSTGTSDSTVIVVGALALILQIHGNEMQGEDGKFDDEEMTKVKSALANSSLKGQQIDAIHSNKSGYGELNAVAWLEEILVEFNLNN